jgi:hypothetical protein
VRATGINGEVELHEHHLLMRREGFFNTIGGLAGEKSIPLASITAVTYHGAGFFSAGFICFSVTGEAKAIRRDRDPNLIRFSSGQEAAFRRLREALEAAIHIPSLAALASQHARARSERSLEASGAENRSGSGQSRILIDASSSPLSGPASDYDIDASLSYEPDWSDLGRRLKSLLKFLLKMTAYSIALSLFVGATGLGRRLEGFDTVMLSGTSFRFITMVLLLAIIVALVSPIARLIPLRSGTRFADFVRRAPRISLTTIIFAIPLILVTGGPSPYSLDRQIVIEGQSNTPSAEAAPEQQAPAVVEVPASDWLGKYDAYFDGATGEVEIAPRSGGRLAISIGMAGEHCAGGIEAVVDRPAGDVITMAKAPYEDRDDQESACRISLRKQGDVLSISEDEVCMNHHGVSCGFEGTASRSR